MPKDQELQNLILAVTSGNPEDTDKLRKYLDKEYAFNSVGTAQEGENKEPRKKEKDDKVRLEQEQRAAHKIHNQDKVINDAINYRFAGSRRSSQR